MMLAWYIRNLLFARDGEKHLLKAFGHLKEKVRRELRFCERGRPAGARNVFGRVFCRKTRITATIDECGGGEGGHGSVYRCCHHHVRTAPSTSPAHLSHPRTHGLISSSSSHNTTPLLRRSCTAPSPPSSAVVAGQQPSRFTMQHALCRPAGAGGEHWHLVACDAELCAAAWGEFDGWWWLCTGRRNSRLHAWPRWEQCRNAHLREYICGNNSDTKHVFADGMKRRVAQEGACRLQQRRLDSLAHALHKHNRS